MNTIVAPGLIAVSLLLLVARGRRVTISLPVTAFKPAPAESQRIPKLGRARHAASQALLAIQQAHPDLLAAVDTETDSDRGSEALERALESVSDADLPAILDWLALDAGPRAAEMSLLLLRRWAETDPPFAAAWASQLPQGPACPAALEQVAIGWASRDLRAAPGWGPGLPAGGAKHPTTPFLRHDTR